MSDIIFSISGDTANGLVEPTTLSNEIIASGLAPALKLETLGDVLTINHTPDLSIPDSVVLVGVVAAHNGIDFSTVDHPGPTGDIIQEAIDVHAADPSAHHVRYTDAEAIAASSGALDHHVRYTDAEASGVAVQVTTSGISNHAAVTDAHHARYTDAEAIAASSGALDHHLRYTDAEASGVAVQVTTSGISNHAAISDAHHARYTDAEAIAASSGALDHHLRYTDAEASGVAVQVAITGIANHAAITDAHHTRYTDAEAIAASSGALDHHVRYTDAEASGVAVQVAITGIANHAAITDAHHARYTDAEAIAASSGALDHHLRYTDAEASGVAVQVATTGIANHAAITDAHHARYTDAEASGVAVQVATTGIANHASITDAHHARYTDAEAIAASSGALDHHVRYTDAEASGVAVQVATTGISNHSAIVDAHHARYTDAEASGVAVQVAITGIANHAAIVDAHHTRYTDAEAIAASSGALDHHVRYTDAEASGVAVQVATTGIANHAAVVDAHHARYTDAEASGVAVQVVTSGIENHAAIVDAHHARYTDAEAISAASGALDHHTRYTDAEASGVAVQVATTGIANHAAITDAHHARYTDAEAIVAATGNVTLQTAYDAGGSSPHIIASIINGVVGFRARDGNSEIFELEDNAGVVQHRWSRETIYMGPAVGNILAASISGLNLSPAVFPTRPTINFGLDQLDILPSDRTITSNFTKISFNHTYTLDFPSASFGAAIGLQPTILLRQAGGGFGMGLLFNNGTLWSNDNGFAVNLGSAFSFVDQPTYRADSASITQPVVRSMISQPRFMVIGGGTLAVTSLQHYYAAGQILAGVTIANRVCFDAWNPTSFGGSITTEHIALKIANLTDGGGGATIRGVQSSMNNGLFIEQLGTAPSEHLSEFRIGSTLAHLGDTDTNLAFTTDTINFNANGVNILRMFSNGATDFVSVNPLLNDVDFFVNGDTGTLIRTDAAIDGLGFHGVTPVALSAAYTVTNDSTDRTYDANATTLDEIADVLGTLIADLQAKGLIG